MISDVGLEAITTDVYRQQRVWLTCLFCGDQAEDLASLKFHCGACQQHPLQAVIKALRADIVAHRRQLEDDKGER